MEHIYGNGYNAYNKMDYEKFKRNAAFPGALSGVARKSKWDIGPIHLWTNAS